MALSRVGLSVDTCTTPELLTATAPVFTAHVALWPSLCVTVNRKSIGPGENPEMEGCAAVLEEYVTVFGETPGTWLGTSCQRNESVECPSCGNDPAPFNVAG